MADNLARPAVNDPIIVHGNPGSVSVESVGARPVVYTGEQVGQGRPVDDITSALKQLFDDKGLVDSAHPTAAGLTPIPQPAVPMDEEYSKRLVDRESAAFEAQLAKEAEDETKTAEHMSMLADAGKTALNVAKDVTAGVALEGAQSILTGAKKTVNETLDLIETAADQLPGAAVVWGDTDFNPETDNGVRLVTGTGAEMKAKTGVQKFLSGLSIAPKDEPTTTTGKVIEGISQFATGMLGAGKLLKGWSAATRAGQVGKAMASGAISDFAAFDGHQERLSNLLAHVAPDQAKPIFEFLASDKDDPEIVGRMKNAVEGLGLGAAADGFMGALRGVRAMRLVKAQARTAARAEGLQIDPAAEVAKLQAEATTADATVKAALGDPADAGPLVRFSQFKISDEGVAFRLDFADPKISGAYKDHQVRGMGVERRPGTDQWQVNQVAVPEGMTGKGLGKAIYKAAAEEAARRGGRLVSDSDVSDSAAKVWESLSRDGWTIEKNPAARFTPGKNGRDGSWHTTGLMPVFEVKIKAAGVPKGSTQSLAKGVTDATIDPNSFDINFARIDTPDDVKAVISTLLEQNAKDVEGARRGVRSWEETQKAAGKLDWVSAMAARRTGQAVNAETAYAFRQALNASATKLLALAKAVKDAPSVANQYAFRRMLSVHRAIQLEYMGARAEAGRALNAYKITAGAPERNLRQIDSLIASSGGAEAATDLAASVLKVAKDGDGALNAFVAEGAMARSRDLIRLVRTNSLLSGWRTPVRNIIGNTGAALLKVASHAVAPRLSTLVGDVPVTQVGEASAMLHGQMMAMRDMFRINPKDVWEQISANGFEAARRDGMWRAAAPGIDAAAPKGIRLHAEREEAGAGLTAGTNSRPLTAASWGVDEDSTMGRVLDVTQMLVESPSNLNATTDDFFKVIAARASLHAQSFRTAMGEVAGGSLEQAGVKARMAELMDNPTEAMLTEAEREMHELTFTRQTPGIAQDAANLRKTMDSVGPIPWGSVILPFLRTPANLISTGMRYSPLAPFMRRWGEDMAEGGARAEVAKAQMAIGTAVWGLLLGMAADGTLTGNGPGNPQQKEALMRADEFGGVKWQPNSVLVNGTWVSIQGLDPMSTSMLLAANMGEIASNGDWSDAHDETLMAVGAHAIAGIGQAFFEKSSLQGAFDAVGAVTGNDPVAAEKFIKDLTGSFVPASGLLRSIRQTTDPYLRGVSSALDSVRNVIPGLSETLPIQHDLWGRERTYQSGLGTVYDVLSPVKVKEAGGSLTDLEILDQGVVVSMPQKSFTVPGYKDAVSLKNHLAIYEDYVQLAGKPAFERLEAVMAGTDEDSAYYKGLSDGPDGEKAVYIQDIISAYRKDARAQILEKYGPELEALAAKKAERIAKARGGEE